MKVALIVEWLDAWRGGAETSTQQFIRHLLDLGVELEIYTRSRAAAAPGLAIHTVGSSSPSRLRSSLLFPRRAAAVVREAHCDVVHSIVPCLAADVYQPRGGTVAETIERNIALRRSPTARRLKRLTSRLNARQRSRLRVERQLLTRSPRPIVVAISNYVRDQLMRHYGYPASHIRSVFNGVDPDTADEAQRRADRSDVRSLHHVAEDEVLALLVAHNFKLKGVRRWIEAQSRMKETGRGPIRSLIVGKESSIRWRKGVTRAGLSDWIQFVGPTQRIGAYYHAADFLVHPTYYDPCSRVVLESLASGLPCITTRLDGAAEVIEDGVNGFVLDSPDDVDAIVDRAQRLTNGDLRRRFRQRSAPLRQRISMRRHAEQMLGVYECAMRQRNRS